MAVDRDGEIASFSNRCGIAADWCIAAPGERVPIAYYGYDEDRGLVIPGTKAADGTSFAAPMVSGGLAVMKRLFRGQLSGTALVAQLFDTADKTGRYVDRGVYGQGLMDLGAATAPVGGMTIAAAGRVEAGGAGLRDTGLALGRAFGDGPAVSLPGREIAAFDELGAPFWFDLGDFVGVAGDPSMARRLRDLTAPARGGRHFGVHRAPEWTALTVDPGGAAVPGAGRLRAGLLGAPEDAAGGHLALVGTALAATAFTNHGMDGRSPVSGSTLSWRPSGALLGLTAGWLAEREELLGTGARGAFGGLSADTGFFGIETGFAVGPWSLAAAGELGSATPRNRRGLIAGMSPLATSAFALVATRRLEDGGSIRLSLTQPLRVEDGRAVLSVPVGRTRDGAVLRRSVVADLEPSGRQIDLAARWRRPLAAGGEIGLGAGWTIDPHHVAGAKPDATLMAG